MGKGAVWKVVKNFAVTEVGHGTKIVSDRLIVRNSRDRVEHAEDAVRRVEKSTTGAGELQVRRQVNRGERGVERVYVEGGWEYVQ